MILFTLLSQCDIDKRKKKLMFRAVKKELLDKILTKSFILINERFCHFSKLWHFLRNCRWMVWIQMVLNNGTMKYGIKFPIKELKFERSVNFLDFMYLSWWKTSSSSKAIQNWQMRNVT